ncbi:MAG: hypothetical protein ACJ0Q9_03470 [Gammaproteobacteria bacterium]
MSLQFLTKAGTLSMAKEPTDTHWTVNVVDPSVKVSIMLTKDKAKECADRIADINQQVQTGDVNFEQASG